MTSRFSHALLQGSFTSKCLLWSRIEAKNFSKNKVFKLKNCRLYICRLKSELNYSEEKRQKNVRFVDDALKPRGIKYLMLRIGYCCLPPLSKFLATRLRMNRFLNHSLFCSNCFRIDSWLAQVASSQTTCATTTSTVNHSKHLDSVEDHWGCDQTHTNHQRTGDSQPYCPLCIFLWLYPAALKAHQGKQCIDMDSEIPLP